MVDSFPTNAMGKIIRTRLPGLLAQNPALYTEERFVIRGKGATC